MKFFNYCEEIKRRNPVSEQYQTWLSLQDKGDEIGCSCQLSVSSESHGFASDIVFRCDRKIDGAAEPHEVKAEASLVREGSLSNSRLVHAKYQLNHRVVAFLQNCGAGGEHAAALAGFLNLQPSSQYSCVYSSTEDEWGQVITEVANQSMEDGLELEKSAMLAHYDGGVGFDEMYADAEDGQCGPLFAVNASFDTHWPKAGNRRKYRAGLARMFFPHQVRDFFWIENKITINLKRDKIHANTLFY